MNYIRFFDHISIRDTTTVGGKNASLGQMTVGLSGQGIDVPFGFAITTDVYRYFLQSNGIDTKVEALLEVVSEQSSVDDVQSVSNQIAALINLAVVPDDVKNELETAYQTLSERYGSTKISVAVRSSATAEDTPHASFAGLQETVLNVSSVQDLCSAYKKVIASLFSAPALTYRIEKGIDHASVAMAVSVQKMVRADIGVAGVAFTADTETGNCDTIVINASYGLGELLVHGSITPDEFRVHKPTFKKRFRPIIHKKMGAKTKKMVYGSGASTVQTVDVSPEDQNKFALSDDQIMQLAKACITIEKYYQNEYGPDIAMDIEWAIDGDDGKLHILQARPETVHSQQKNGTQLKRYVLDQPVKGNLNMITMGQAIGRQIAHGRAYVANSLDDMADFKKGDVLIVQSTSPDWVPYLKQASAVVAQRGGRTSHTAIVCRELGIPALVGVQIMAQSVSTGQSVTVVCSEGTTGYLFGGQHSFSVTTTDLHTIPQPPVEVMLNLAEPETALVHAQLPVSGVGLARTEFIIANMIGVHPNAANNPDFVKNTAVRAEIEKRAAGYASVKDFFVQTLAQGVATIAAAFYSRQVIVRLSDFKSNEYHNLLGGLDFELLEENPMLGLRGASRYYSSRHASGFALECEAMHEVIYKKGFSNITLMVPFVRTPAEAEKVIKILNYHGLESGKDNLQIYMMCELPSNVLQMDVFCSFFDGFSIGSNDLTQMVLGVDRDQEELAELFDERNQSVQMLIGQAIATAKQHGKKIGICGQGPSDYPEFAQFLIERGIDSISLNPDSVLPFLQRTAAGAMQKKSKVVTV